MAQPLKNAKSRFFRAAILNGWRELLIMSAGQVIRRICGFDGLRPKLGSTDLQIGVVPRPGGRGLQKKPDYQITLIPLDILSKSSKSLSWGGQLPNLTSWAAITALNIS